MERIPSKANLRLEVFRRRIGEIGIAQVRLCVGQTSESREFAVHLSGNRSHLVAQSQIKG